jgi:hypothetical protein
LGDLSREKHSTAIIEPRKRSLSHMEKRRTEANEALTTTAVEWPSDANDMKYQSAAGVLAAAYPGRHLA